MSHEVAFYLIALMTEMIMTIKINATLAFLKKSKASFCSAYECNMEVARCLLRLHEWLAKFL